jgi:hypothetical protein
LTSPSPEGSAPRPSGTGGLQTPRRRATDSNPRSPVGMGFSRLPRLELSGHCPLVRRAGAFARANLLTIVLNSSQVPIGADRTPQPNLRDSSISFGQFSRAGHRAWWCRGRSGRRLFARPRYNPEKAASFFATVLSAPGRRTTQAHVTQRSKSHQVRSSRKKSALRPQHDATFFPLPTPRDLPDDTLGKHTGNQPARLAHLDDGNDCAILVQGDEGPAQSLPRRRPGSFGWGIRALHQLVAATMVPSPRRLPHTISPLERRRFETLVPPPRAGWTCLEAACSPEGLPILF